MQSFIMLLLLTVIIHANGCTQQSGRHVGKKQQDPNDLKVGGGCEGCEAIYESPVSFDLLNETDTLPDFMDQGPKIEISGIIYHRDGKTPAPGVVLYVYHTDQTGIYPKKKGETGMAGRHGYIRGWIKTNSKGEYKFYTLVPASYPNSSNPKHIHPTIKEQGKSEYWINDFVFEDDPLLPASERNKINSVGGNGVLKTKLENGMLRATRHIILGLNVKDYPDKG